MDVRGKVALVTGATSGIGRATTLELARRGCSLILVARTAKRLSLAAKEVREAGAPRVEAVAADLATAAGVQRVVEHATQLGGFDILVNNAGAGLVQPFESTRTEDLERLLALNLQAPFLLTQAAVPILRRRGGGQVVQVASGLAYRGLAGWSAYAASKFGLRGFTECVREEVAKEGIKVGIVAPGYTESAFFDGIPPSGGGPRSFEGSLQPEDAAHAILAMVTQGPASDIKEILVRNRLSPL